jgi:hypothetical protein
VAASRWTGIGEGDNGATLSGTGVSLSPLSPLSLVEGMGHGGPFWCFGVQPDRAPLNRSIAFPDGWAMSTVERENCYVLVVSISQTPSSAVAGQSNSAGNGRGRQLED